MDETRATYGTTTEAVITLADSVGNERTIKLPNPDSFNIETRAAAFAALATDSDTAVLYCGSNQNIPTSVKVDIVTTIRESVYSSGSD